MTENKVTPAGRLEVVLDTYRLYGSVCACNMCDAEQSVNDCRQAFPHVSYCSYARTAETHPWIVINTSIDWAMRRTVSGSIQYQSAHNLTLERL